MSCSFSRAFLTLSETLKLDFNLVSKWAHDVDSYLETKKDLSRLQRVGLYAGLSAGVTVLAVWNPLQVMGAVSLGFLELAPFMKDNRHKRGNNVFGCAILGPQLYMLGAYVGTFQMAVAATRAFTMNVIDDDSYKTRIGISTIFWLGAVGITAGAGLVRSPWDVLPLLAMTCATVADACPDKMTHIARLGRMIGAGFLMPYHIVVSGSLAALASEMIGSVNLFRTAVQNDVPVRDEQGQAIQDTAGQFAGWVKSVRRLQRIPEDRAGRADPLDCLWKLIGSSKPTAAP